MFRTILAPLTGADCDANVLALALRLANAQTGHIECLRVVPNLNAVAAQIEQFGVAGLITLADRLARLEREANERTTIAKSNFNLFCRNTKIDTVAKPRDPKSISANYCEDTGDEVDRVTRLSRYYDAVVLAGGLNHNGRLPAAALGTIILVSGRPVLLAPAVETAGAIKTIAIAWKDTAEAARSLTAAMPLLEQANRIHVFCAEEGGETKRLDRIASYENIIRYLRWHGFKADSHFVTVGIRTAAEAVLDGARSAEADLLVMGAYGRARLRELIFGGFTQEILKGNDFPVFLFH